MKKYFSGKKLLMVVAMFVFGVMIFAADIEVTIYCDEGYQPYSYADGKEAKGVYVDVVKKALTQVSGYKVKIEPIPWKRGVKDLESGDSFALFPPYNKPKDRPWMEYSVPILDEEVVLVLSEDKAKKVRTKWPDDYGDITIGINSGFLTPKQEDRVKLKIDESGKTTDQNILKLGMGRIDGYVNDKMSIFDTLNQLKKEAKYKKEYSNVVVAMTIAKESGYVGYKVGDNSKFPFKEDFKKKLDKALSDMKKSGEIDKILAKYVQ